MRFLVPPDRGGVCGSAGAQEVSDVKNIFSHCMFIKGCI
jgi:hypothetical protein